MIDITQELNHPETKRWHDTVAKYARLSWYKQALDIGTGGGISSHAMGVNGTGQIISIGIQQNRTARGVAEEHGYLDRITFHKIGSDDFFKQNTTYFDLISIDGSHEPEDVFKDALNSWRWLKRDSYMIFDDYEHEKLGKQIRTGVGNFLDWLEKERPLDEFTKIEENGRLIIRKL